MRNAALLGSLLLAGCNLAPKYRPPAAPVAPAYPAASDRAEASALPSDTLGYRDYFLDPRLRALLDRALRSNRDLAQSVAQIAQARARFRIQDSQRLPTFELNADGTRSRTPSNSLGFGGAVPGAGDAAQPAAIEVEQYNANVGVASYELDFWGRLRNLAEAERLRYLGTIEGVRAARLTLVANVASTYFSIRGGEARIALAERTLEGRRRGVAIAKDRLDAGVTSTVDFDQSVQLETQAEADLAEVRRTTQQSRNYLEVLVGGPVTGALPAALPFETSPVRSISAGLPSDLLINRPDIREAEYNLRAAGADIGALRAQFFPSISLTGALGFASPAIGDLFKGDSVSWNFGGALNLPIFDWGRRRAQVREAQARADELVALYQRTTQSAFQEVADALVGRERYQEQLAATTREVQAQRRLVETARLRYDNGIAIYLEVLDAERNLFATEQELLQLRATELQNVVTLYTALGGGQIDRTAPFEVEAGRNDAR